MTPFTATLGFIAHWCLFMPTNTHYVCRRTFLLSNTPWSNLSSECYSDLWRCKTKVSLILWTSHHSQEVWDIWHVTDLCSSDVWTSSLQSCTVILRLSTTLPVCTVSEIMMHALRSAKEIGYTGQVSRAGVRLRGDKSRFMFDSS